MKLFGSQTMVFAAKSVVVAVLHRLAFAFCVASWSHDWGLVCWLVLHDGEGAFVVVREAILLRYVALLSGCIPDVVGPGERQGIVLPLLES